MARWGMAAITLLVLAGLGAVPSALHAQIGFVNTTVILQQTPGYDAADSTLAAERTGYQEEATALQAQLDSAMTAFDQQQLVLSPQAREERLDELRALNDRVQNRIQELQSQAMERERELVAPLEQRITDVIDGIRAERNLAVIFDVANPSSAILSADPAMNLTDLVISRLQAAGTP